MYEKAINHSLEQQLSDEVRYLHALWHLGPPHSSNSNSNPNPKPTTTPITLSPSPSTSFKKKKKKKKKTMIQQQQTPHVEWECEPPSIPQTQTGWPEPLIPKPQPASPQELQKFAAIKLQQRGLRACQEFFSKNHGGSEGEEEVEEEEEEDDFSEGDDGGEGEESEVLDFFLGIFKEDNELRTYYEKNYEDGIFCCLVCGGIGEKVGKRFKNCGALVQHSIAISKTKRRSAHRAFGQAICRVLGWNINRLPSIVLSLGETLGQILLKKDSLENNSHAESSVTNAANVGNAQNENIGNGFHVHNSGDPEKGGQSEFEVGNNEANDDIDADELYKDLDGILDPNRT